MKNAEGFKFMKSDSNDKRSRQNYVNASQTMPHKNWNHNSHDHNNTGFEGYRKKSNQFGGGNGNNNHHSNNNGNHSNHYDKPFSHLGANYSGDDKNRVYRVKAPSHI